MKVLLYTPLHKMAVGRIRRVKCGFATKARERSQAREGEGGVGRAETVGTA